METLDGLIEQVAPAGAEGVRLTPPVNPFAAYPVTAKIPVVPVLTVMVAGLFVRLKSHEQDVTVTVMLAECAGGPFELTVIVYVPGGVLV